MCRIKSVLLFALFVIIVTAGVDNEGAKEIVISDSGDELVNTTKSYPGQKPGCQKRYYNPNKIDPEAEDSFVCACNGTYCDEIEDVGDLGRGKIVYFISSKDDHRLKRYATELIHTAEIEGNDGLKEVIRIRVNASNRYQEILGFGGAFTDAAGMQFRLLSRMSAEKLLEAYFGDNGINYTLCRVPIASNDFSTREYSYLEKEDDFNLTTFSLTSEDFRYKIPYMLKALELSKSRLKLFGSPWSAPSWMKTNGHMKGGGELKGDFNGKYYDTYAKYFVRFLEEYEKRGLTFWAVTIENEPSIGKVPDRKWKEKNFLPFQIMYLSSQMQVDFAHKLLRPALRASKAGRHVKIIAHDDQRNTILNATKTMYADEEKADAIDGTAVHWYAHIDFQELTDAHTVRPDKFILSTEACTGNGMEHGVRGPLLGDWHRAEEYADDILENMRNWVAGWTDWNMALNLQGGPSLVANSVDAPILVNATADEFLKQPMFYALAHFSRFVPSGSIRVDSYNTTRSKDSVKHVAFHTAEGRRVLVLLNMNVKSVNVLIEDASWADASAAQIRLPPKSFTTAIWSSQS